MSISIHLNGEATSTEARTVADLLAGMGIDPAAKGVAIAVNDRVVRRPEWSASPVDEGDRIEVVRPFQGG